MNDYQEKVYQNLKEKGKNKAEARYLHSIGVAETACKLAQQYYPELDQVKVYLTGLIHDYAKFESLSRYQEVVNTYQLDKSIFDEVETIYHAVLGCYIVREELAITDQEIIDAIYYHASGNEAMTPLQEVIYLADFIEPNREERFTSEIREVAKTNIKKAIALTAKAILEHLQQKKYKIHKNAYLTYHGYKKYLKEDEWNY